MSYHSKYEKRKKPADNKRSMRKKMVPLSTDSSGGERDRLVAIEAVSVTPKSLQHETDDAYRVVNQIAFRKNFRTLMNHFVDSE